MNMLLKAIVLAVMATAILSIRSDHTMDPSQTLLLYPWPNSIKQESTTLDIASPCSFQLELQTKPTDAPSTKVLQEILEFYNAKIFRRALEYCETHGIFKNDTATNSVDKLKITIENLTVAPPKHEEDESYTLDLGLSGLSLTAKTYSGFLRGLESFSQLVYYDEENSEIPYFFIPNTTISITDAPKYTIRGITLDVTVNFISKQALQRVIDGMMYSKMNTLHLILSSDHSFPIQLKTFPNITFHGAWSEEERYTAEDIAELVNYATSRGVRIIPQVNIPSNVRAMLLDPDLAKLGICKEAQDSGMESTILNPVEPKSLEIATGIVKDLAAMFPDEFIYIGNWGDNKVEVCYSKTPEVTKYVADNKIDGSMSDYFLSEVIKGAAAELKNKTAVLWMSGPAKKFKLPEEQKVIFHMATDQWAKQTITDNPGHKFFTAGSAFNLGCGMGNWKGEVGCGFRGWLSYANGFNPISDDVNYVGFTSFVQGDLVNDQTVEFYLWPKAAVIAEKLWMKNNAPKLWRRAGGLELRYNFRGIACQPLACEWCQRHIDECLGGN